VNDRSIHRGLQRQLENRRRLLDQGGRRLGWKAAFGAPASLEQFGLDGPLVGFMTDRSIVESRAEVDIADWTRAVAEPEIVVYLDDDLPAGADDGQVRSAIGAVGAAIELADIFQPPDDIESALAVNVFHQSVILGEPDRSRSGADLSGLEAQVRVDGAVIAVTRDVEALTGRIPRVLSHLSGLLAGHGEGIRAGDVVICGSVVPPFGLSSGTTFEFELRPLAPISVRAV
jgi:2-keto-4-pentenoate hydratase